jgi:negative regulator of sigma E activity
MTPSNDHDEDRRNTDDVADRMREHHRQQLSALLDGELPPEEARFLLRRLEHDDDLKGAWERWQHAGDVLRGRAATPVSVAFAARVADALAREPKVSSGATGHRWLRWGSGAALAASVAVVALLLARHAPDEGAAVPRDPVATTTTPSPAAPAAPTIPAQAQPAPVPDRAAGLATALAVADVPRRIGMRRSRGQSQRAAVRAPAAQVARASTEAVAAATDPFSGAQVHFPDRPWPRALLPASPAAGAFNVDYGTRRVAPPTLYPFAPRTASPERAEPPSNP